MPTPRFAIATAVILAASIVLLPARADAHTASTYYVDEWDSNVTVCWGINTGFPTGNPRTRAREADDRWNNAAGSPAPEFFNCLLDDINHGNPQNACNISGINTGAIYWNDLDYIDPGLLGATRKCASSALWNFTIEFDNDQSWYFGTGDAPASQWDFLSIAVHEFGHAFGFWGHFPESDSICPETTARETMCPGNPAVRGTEHLRSLGTHDIHTFDAAY
jgi:hypothetical protein